MEKVDSNKISIIENVLTEFLFFDSKKNNEIKEVTAIEKVVVENTISLTFEYAPTESLL